MKKISLLLLLSILFAGCNSGVEKVGYQKSGINFKGHLSDNNYKVVEFEYDGCEYIAFGEYHSLSVTHKGNCKYCEEKNGIKVK